MEARPWVVSVLSTFYDLEEQRNAIINELRTKGITVSAFELPEFPVENDCHSHDSCLVALTRADIAILIINKRSGGIYHNSTGTEKPIFITAKECAQAIKQNIPLFVFVKKEAWDERHTYKKYFSDYINEKDANKKKSKKILSKLKSEFDSTIYKCSYVDSVSTIDFIESINKTYDEYHVSNWISTYDRIDDLLEAIVGKLKGYSRKLLELLSLAQRDVLLDRHTSTAFGMTLRDVFKSEYYVQPPYKVESGEMSSNELGFDEDISSSLRNNKSILIYGEAGYGKTTILAKCFAEHVDKYLSSPSYCIPLFLSLRNKGKNYHFNIRQYIDEEIENSRNDKLRHKPYPYLDISQIRFNFYCDGFDEMAEKLSNSDLDRISSSGFFQYPILLTCRQQYANRYLQNHLFTDKFGIRIRIEKWDTSKAMQYVTVYCNKRDIKNGTRKKIFAAIERPELHEILDSPLLITMFLLYIEKVNVKVQSITTVNLFENWITELARRERIKLPEGISETNIVDIWEVAAWEIYRNKLTGMQQGLRIDDFIEPIKKEYNTLDSFITPSLFEALFECDNERMIGTFHEQFMEYLVAKVLINSCISKCYPYPDFLQFVIRPEINRYFREIWEQCNKTHKDSIFNALHSVYLHNAGGTSTEEIMSRVQAIYYITRLDSPNSDSCIEKAFNFERHISVILSLFFGAIKKGHLDKEEEFYNLLIRNNEYNEANRGYHLAYYADSIVGDELPFKDNITRVWAGTLKAFQRHFSSSDIRHYFLRRIDLITMRQFIDARHHVEPLTNDILSSIGKAINAFAIDEYPEYKDYNEKIKKEYKNLVEVFSSYEHA